MRFLYPIIKKCLPFMILLGIILTTAFLHLLFMHYAPEPKLFGDEEVYLKAANQDAERGDISLLPGRLRFDHRPTFISRVYAQFIKTGDAKSSVLNRIGKLNLVMLLFLLILVYCQARLLQIGQIGSLAGCAFLAFFPWFGFYVHSLWPEMLHAALLGLAFTFILTYLVRGYWILLLPAGVCLGYTMFLGWRVNNFTAMAIAYLVGATLFIFKRPSRSQRILYTAVAGMAITAGVLIVILPQLIVNANAGHGYRLSANQWRNIEWGIRKPVENDPPALRKLTWEGFNQIYKPYTGSLAEREELSKQRTQKFINSMPWTTLVTRQLKKLSEMIFKSRSHFEYSVEVWQRWGGPPPQWISALKYPARWLWNILLVFALIGFSLFGWRSPGWSFLSLFAIYYILLLLVIPFSPHFATQLVPILCIFAGAAVSWMVDLRRGDQEDYYFEKTDGLFIKVYAAISNIGEFCLQRKKMLLLSGSLVLIPALALIAVFILQNFPNSGDEYSYIYQAKTFLAGRLWNNPHPLQQFFEFNHIFHVNSKVYSQFVLFPGWPLLLTCALFFKVPLYLVNPILGTLSLLMLFLLGKKLYSGKIAILAVFLTMLSSFFLFNSASYFSHTLCSLLILLFVYHSLSFIDETKAYHAVLSAVFLGAAFITRPYSVLWCCMPIFVYLLVKLLRHPQKVVWVLVGGTPFVLLLAFYNYETTGNAFWFLDLTALRWIGLGFTLKGMMFTYEHLKDFMRWTPPFILIIYFIYLLDFLKKPRENFIGLIFLSLVVGYLFYSLFGGEQYGPRYLYEGFPFLILFVTSKLFKEDLYSQKDKVGKALFRLFILSLLLSIPMSAKHFIEEREIIWERKEPYRLVEREKIKNAIIFLKTGAGVIRGRRMYREDLTRNKIDFSNSVLYALDLGEDNKELMQYYPEKEYYVYSYDENSKQGYLKRYYP